MPPLFSPVFAPRSVAGGFIAHKKRDPSEDESLKNALGEKD